MQEWPDDHLDDLFRKSTEEADVPFDPMHWVDMNNRLDEHDRQGFYDRWRIWGGTAALAGLLLITLWWAWKITTVTANSVAGKVDNQAIALKKNDDDSQRTKRVTARVTAISAPATGATMPASRAYPVTHYPTVSRPTPGVMNQPVATPDWAVRSRAAGQWRRRATTGVPAKTGVKHRSMTTNRPDDENESVTTLNRSGSPATKRIAEKQRRPEGVASRSGAGQPAPLRFVAEPNASTEKTTANEHRSDRLPEPISSTNALAKRSGGFSGQPPSARSAVGQPVDSGTVVAQQPAVAPNLERPLLGMATLISSLTAVKTGPLPALTEPEWEDMDRPAKRVVTPVQRFSIMAVVSPDLSGIGLRDFTKPGTNAGLMVQYRITNRFSLQTGVLISTKKYQTNAEYYVWPATWAKDPWPSNISGTCTMYDIPLNLRYDWLLHPMGDGVPPARWFASAGLTSYFIRREIYTYDYDNPTDPRIAYRGWDNQKAGVPGGKFGFSNLNVSIGYERPMGRHLSWQVEPFMKIPLQQVGFFKVRLLSTGAFIGLKYTF